MSSPHTFPKTERLCSRKLTASLFAPGSHAFSAFPLRVVFRVLDDAEKIGKPPVQLLVSVSKRRFKHAVDRNRTKRQIREAWRLNRDILLSALPPERQLIVAFIWLADELQPSDLIHRKLKNLLHRMAEQIGGLTDRRINGLTD